MYSETGGGGGTLIQENRAYSYPCPSPSFPPDLRRGQYTYKVREQELGIRSRNRSSSRSRSRAPENLKLAGN